MSKKREFYFLHEDSEMCYTKEYFTEDIKEAIANGKDGLEVFKAEKYIDSEFFFCKAVGECGIKGECGSDCPDYAPRNGKNGCCKHFGNSLYQPTEKVLLKL